VRNDRSRAGNEKQLTKMKALARTNKEHIRCGLHLLACPFADGLRHIALVAKETTALTTHNRSLLGYWYGLNRKGEETVAAVFSPTTLLRMVSSGKA